MPIRWHEDSPALLREAMLFTAEETGFEARLIEKDYFASVLLEYLAAHGDSLTFKGGTCLSKVHAAFYRLSEDLDFSVPTAFDCGRAERRRHAAVLRKLVAEIPDHVRAFVIVEPLVGANNSTQYTAAIGYQSLLDPHLEPISIEVGLREPLLMEAAQAPARTVLLNPVDGQPMVEPVRVRSLSHAEAMAEKLRAALCRRELAIRDFFDVDHAVRNGLDPRRPELLDLVRRKLAVPGTGAVDVSDTRMKALRPQLDTRLRPVLRAQEFAGFDLERAVATVRDVARWLDGG